MVDARLAVGVTSKFGDKCLVMRLRFAVIRDFCFQEEILNERIESKDV